MATIALALVVWAIVVRNRFIRAGNLVENAWADIDVQLTRRHDLVPNLVATVKGYARHETELLESVTRLRNQARGTASRHALGDVEQALEQRIGKLFALHEAYPDLKASENFRQLQDELVEVEDHLQYARRFYNGSVRDLNNALETFPNSVIARVFSFHQAEFFQADNSQRVNPEVVLS